MAETIHLAVATAKVATGIAGFDSMANGGLPIGRITVAVGAAGAGKTVFAMQTLIHRLSTGPGVGILVSFEQSVDGIAADLDSFAWNAKHLLESGRLIVVDGRPQMDTLISGTFDLAGLFAMVEGAALPEMPCCVVFDGIDALMGLLGSPAAQRAELLRLQDHVQRLGATAILTIKGNPETGSGFEEISLYMADCVVELMRDGRDGMSHRSISIQKYRGSGHSLSRLPFIVTEQGIDVEGIDSDPHPAPVSGDRLSMGVPQLDVMLAGGIYRGTSTLLSGSPGTAKTTLGLAFLDAMCRRGERALGICFDEGPEEIIRNVASVGVDLKAHVDSGLLNLHGIVNQSAGTDEFAHEIGVAIRRHRPRHVLIDPISVFTEDTSSQSAVRRIIQLCKREGITVVLTSLLDRKAGEAESSRSYVSTMCDTWIHLSYVINGGERNRALTIVKSRGTAHSNQVGELLLSDDGLSIAETYTEDGSVLMGSLRFQKERASQEAIRAAEDEAARLFREAERSAEELAGRIAALTSELEDKRGQMERLSQKSVAIVMAEAERRAEMSRIRSHGEVSPPRAEEGP